MRILNQGFLLLGCLLPMSLLASGDRVGEVSFKRGSVFADGGDGQERALEVADPVSRGDRLRSGASSFSIVEFEDANKLAVRPNSLVVVAEYLANEARIALEKGGLQATVRAVDHQGVRRVYRFDAGTVEIDVEDARFDLRHCGPECAEENLQVLKSQGVLPKGAIGRVALVRGSVEVSSGDANGRRLRMGQPVFAGERLRSARHSHALLVFSDGSQLVVDQESTVRLGDIRYQQEETDQFEVELIHGGMRALTGVLGKQDAKRVRYQSPVATTGVRGTGFDLICQGGCEFPAYTDTDPAQLAENWPDGLYAGVWDGTVVQANEAGAIDVAVDTYAYVPNRSTLPLLLPARPKPLDRMISPRPEPFAGDDLAHQQRLWQPTPGTYLYIHEGEIRVRSEDGSQPERTYGANRYVFVSPDGEVSSGQGAPPFLYYDAACPRCSDE